MRQTMTESTSVLVGIAGASGAGKSRVARLLAEAFPGKAALVSEDWYCHDLSHLAWPARSECNVDHPDSIDHALLAQHLEMLREGKTALAPQYDYATFSRSAAVLQVEPRPLMLVEGIMVLSAAVLAPYFDLRIYVEAPLDLCLHRRLLRDQASRGLGVEHTLRQYTRTIRPMFHRYIEPARERADIVIGNEEGFEHEPSNLQAACARIGAALAAKSAGRREGAASI
jgi:uridine kinase